jgi:hypothetical protein
MNRFPLVVLIAALAIIAVVAWEPLRSRAGLLSPFPSPSPTVSPSPSPPLAIVEASPTPEPTPEPTPGVTPRYTHCIDGSALTVTSADETQVNYKCASGATGAYLR